MLKIISGGQTGVDRGALGAALEFGVECGGWCPAGRLAEDGKIPERYPLKEMPTAEYSERTRRNIEQADGTLIIFNGELSGGTRETLEFCREERKPYLVIDCAQVAIEEAQVRAMDFTRDLSSRAKAKDLTVAPNVTEQSTCSSPALRLGMTHFLFTLNVAGPRASQWPEGDKVAHLIISAILRRLSGHQGASE